MPRVLHITRRGADKKSERGAYSILTRYTHTLTPRVCPPCSGRAALHFGRTPWDEPETLRAVNNLQSRRVQFK
jgi:hypothetical protein